MNIHEYQSKKILSDYGVKIARGVVILQKSEIEDVISSFDCGKYVVKAQIYSGARGKAGGIKITSNKEEAKIHARTMYGKHLVTAQTTSTGNIVERIYIEEGLEFDQHYYLSLIINKKSGTYVFIGSAHGGVEIEKLAKEKPEYIKKMNICPFFGLHNFQIVNFAKSLGISGNNALKSFMKLIWAMYEIFQAYDATQIEINPLCLDHSEEFIALDAKVSFDENALFRHEELLELNDENQYDQLEVRASRNGLSYVKMDGNIGCMVNGAGLAMATMDIIKFYNGLPANFLDVGGGADVDKVREAFDIIKSDTSVTRILVNIFGGIMKCDVIAQGIISAVHNVGLDLPLVVRLEGTNVSLGKKLLRESGIEMEVVDDISEAAKKAVSIT